MKNVATCIFLLLVMTFCAYGQKQKLQLQNSRIAGIGPTMRLAPNSINSAVPARITYQGVLTGPEGTPVADDSYAIEFSLWPTLSGGIVPDWRDTIDLSVAHGAFAAILGSGKQLNVIFDKTYFVELKIVGGPPGPSYPETMSPRTELTAAPYALAPWIPTTSGNDIYFNAGNVGIGISNPAERLHVIGDGTFEGDGLETILRLRSNGSSNDPNEWLLFSTGIGSTKATAKFVIQDNSRGGNHDRLAIDSMGNIGIGTLLPSAKLDVAGDARFNGHVRIADGSEGAGKVLTSDANGFASWQTPAVGGGTQWATNGANIYSTNAGNVGIGTSTPSQILHAVVDGASSRINMQSFGGVGAFCSTVAAGTLASPLAIPATTMLGLQVVGHNGSGYSSVYQPMKISSTEAWTPSANGHDIVFSPVPNGSTTPLTTLTIDPGIIYVNGEMRATGSTNGFSMMDRATGAHAMIMYLDNDVLKFDDYAVAPSRMVIHRTSGNVGIGTATPTEKLEVVGNLKIGGATIHSGAGSPEGVVTGNPGDMYLNTSGGAGVTLYIKESGSGTTGWVAK